MARFKANKGTFDVMIAASGNEAALRTGLESLARRSASAYPEPLRDPLRYLRTLLPAEAERARRDLTVQAEAAAGAAREQPARRQARWLAEWLRRRRAQCADAIRALDTERRADLVAEVLADFQRRNAHPSMAKRLQLDGWEHPLVIGDVIRFYAAGALGERWDVPSAQDLLEIASEMGEGGSSPGA